MSLRFDRPVRADRGVVAEEDRRPRFLAGVVRPERRGVSGAVADELEPSLGGVGEGGRKRVPSLAVS